MENVSSENAFGESEANFPISSGCREPETAAGESESREVIISHICNEVRAKMNGVLGLVELLLESHLSDEQREMARMALCATEDMIGVVYDILDFSMLEAGNLSLKPEPMVFRRTVEDAILPFKAEARSKGLVFESEFRAIPEKALGDPKRVARVISHLVGNAVKFTAFGGVRLEAEARETDDGRLQIVASVSDTGIGIPADKLPRLFDLSARLDDPQILRVGTEGLGLAVCKGLVELMGGTIEVESVEGAGTIFRVKLILEAVETAGREVAEILTDDHKKHPGDTTILVVEDDLISGKTALFVINKMGLAADWAKNGAEALDKLKTGEYGLILMDCQMPVMDGYAATQAIRGGAAGLEKAATPIVAVTAHAVEGDREKCLATGMDDYAAKPISPDKLRQLIGKWLANAPI